MQEKISEIVQDYIRLYPEEYETFKQAQVVKVEAQRTKFGEAKADVLTRKLHEVPEALFTMLKFRLTEDEFEYFESLEGAKWFAKHFLQFRAAEKV